MQVSGVNEIFWSALNGDLLLLLYSWLLDRLNDQLVGDFARGVYTNKICHATVRTQSNAYAYAAKTKVQTFSLKCFLPKTTTNF